MSNFCATLIFYRIIKPYFFTIFNYPCKILFHPVDFCLIYNAIKKSFSDTFLIFQILFTLNPQYPWDQIFLFLLYYIHFKILSLDPQLYFWVSFLIKSSCKRIQVKFVVLILLLTKVIKLHLCIFTPTFSTILTLINFYVFHNHVLSSQFKIFWRLRMKGNLKRESFFIRTIPSQAKFEPLLIIFWCLFRVYFGK